MISPGNNLRNESRALEAVASMRSVVSAVYPEAAASLLFGSRAKGVHDEQSDADVMLLFDDLAHCFHEARIVDGLRMDVHVMTALELRRQFALQRSVRGCFYATAVSEGVVLADRDGAWPALCAEARAMYASAPPFEDWLGMRLSITSRLNDLHRDWDLTQRCLIASDLLKNALCIRVLERGGWVARMDVMREWLQVEAGDELRELEGAFEMAIAGDVAPFRRVMEQDLGRIGGALRSGERIPVRAA